MASPDLHGSYSGYIRGCRSRHECPASPTCVDAERQYQRDYKRDKAYGRPRKVPAIGSVRRIQALMAIGWSGTYIAEQLGIQRSNLHTHYRFPTIRTPRANAIRELYDRLLESDVGGPSEKTITIARLAGFMPPQAWEGVDMDDPDAMPDYGWMYPDPQPDIDEVAVARAIRGQQVKLNMDERLEAIRQMRESGLSPTDISHRLRMGGSRVLELLQRLEAG